jgi:hypothetical protein
MKILNISILALVLFSSCGFSDTSEKKEPKKDPVKYEKVSLNECIKRIIYMEHKTEVEKYDSISILYYHEFEEYIEPEAIELDREIDSIKKFLSYKELLDASPYYYKMDSLRAELSPYHKFVVGYAFVHTFYDGKDTVSAIFVMDTMCGFGEMTIIKEKIVIDPFDDSTFTKKRNKSKNQ